MEPLAAREHNKQLDLPRPRSLIRGGRRRRQRRSKFKLSEWFVLVVAICAFVWHLDNSSQLFKWLPVASGAVGASSLSDYDGATFYKATAGSRVRMVCNGSHWNDDSVSLVLWFKGSNSVPIYTIDARQKPLNNGARHFVSDAYKARAKFNSRATPPYLDLSPIEAEDQAEFRCRVDYRSRPRENFLVILFVLVPPKSVQVIDSSGRPVEQIYGPLSEGSDLTLLCLSKGGRPAPAVTWKKANKVIDDSYLTLNDFLALADPNLRWLSDASSALRLTSGNASQPSTDSTAASVVESLYLEWRQWPEFDYFAGHLNGSSSNLASAGAESSYVRPATPTGDSANEPTPDNSGHRPAGSGSNQAAGSGGQQQLLELPVHESITTSVNVLRLSSLDQRALATSLADTNHQRHLAHFECQASNLHYDLRTLIKLFAPAALAGSGPTTPSDTRSALATQPAERQLVEAVDRARESALRLVASGLELANRQQQQPVASPSLEPHNSSAGEHVIESLELSHGDKRTNDLVSPAGATSGARLSAGQLGGIAALLYQQLARSHQLGQSAAALAVEQQPPASGAQPELVKTKQISLDIYLRPLEIHIESVGRPKAHAAGQLAEFTCSTSGSRPPAELSWFLNGRALEPKLWRQLNELSGNASHSKLSLQLERQDHGAQLVCRASNEKLAQLLASPLNNNNINNRSAQGQADAASDSLSGSTPTAIEDSISLTVHYPPKLRLELGNKMLSEAIKESSDIYFVCHVDANPPSKEISWLHNDQPISGEHKAQHAASGAANGQQIDGLIKSNNSLVLQRVKLEQRGQYACAASNTEGISESNRIQLRVLHAPICRGPTNGAADPRGLQQAAAGAADSPTQLALGTRSLPLNARSKFLCQMEADPPEVELSWYLSNALSERRVLASERVGAASDRPNRKALDAAAAADQSSANSATAEQREQSSGATSGPTTRREREKSRAERKPAQANADETRSLLVSSQLEYLVESELDYGQLYCVARNSMGEQKRACVYQLQAPDPSEAQPIGCLAVNVTANSVSLGCHQNQLKPPYGFSVAVYRLSGGDGDGDSNSEGAGEAGSGPANGESAPLEAKLSSGRLAEPLFSVTNLRPATSYEFHVLADQPSGAASTSHQRPSVLRLQTQPSSEPANQDADTSERPRAPKLEPIGDQSQQQNLMAALISTRSTNGSGDGSAHESRRRTGAEHQTSAGNAAGSGGGSGSGSGGGSGAGAHWWSRVFGSASGEPSGKWAGAGGGKMRGDQAAAAATNNQLMDWTDTILLVGVCLALAGSLALLLVLHKYSRLGLCSGRLRPTRSASSTGSSSLSSGHSTSSKRAVQDTGSEPSARQAHRPNYSSATLDAQLLAGLQSERLAPAASASAAAAAELSQAELAARVKRSRSSSSVCQQDLELCHLLQAPRLIHLGAARTTPTAAGSFSLERRLISDANLIVGFGQQQQQRESALGLMSVNLEPEASSGSCNMEPTACGAGYVATSPLDIASSSVSASSSIAANNNQQQQQQQQHGLAGSWAPRHKLRVYCNGATSECFGPQVAARRHVQRNQHHHFSQHQPPESLSLVSDEASSSYASNAIQLYPHQVHWSASDQHQVAGQEMIALAGDGDERVKFIHLLHPANGAPVTTNTQQVKCFDESQQLLANLVLAQDDDHNHQSPL